MLQFKNLSNRKKKYSWNGKKFPRHLLKDEYSGKNEIIKSGHLRNNWQDDLWDWSYRREYKTFYRKMNKFLTKNVERNVDEVYSEFLERCDDTIKGWNLRKLFYSYFDENDKFCIDNKIINLKNNHSAKPMKCISNHKPRVTLDKDIIKICKNSSSRIHPQFFKYDAVIQVYGEHRSYSKNNINKLLPKIMPIYLVPFDNYKRSNDWKVVKLDNYIESLWVMEDKNGNKFIEYHKHISEYRKPLGIYSKGIQYIFITPSNIIEDILLNKE